MNEKVLEELKKAVEEQISTANPKEAKETYQTLLSRGHSADEAKEMIAHVVYSEAMAIVTTQKAFNRARYIRNLERMLDGKEPII